MSEPRWLPGKFVRFELVSRDPTKAQSFYRDVLGWTVEPLRLGGVTGDAMGLGGRPIAYSSAPKAGDPSSRWVTYASVEDVDAAVKAAMANGGTLVEGPLDAPDVGRVARIADPQGAELFLIRNAAGDPPDGPPPTGDWLWNELHTTDPEAALSFYEKVLGYEHRRLDMGPAGFYFIVSSGGVDRGGVTGHLPRGVQPHWLPYVAVADTDATIARVRELGGTVPMGPEDVPGAGRLGIMTDPTGATLAIMKPTPPQRG